jgi:hypothetical protein
MRRFRCAALLLRPMLRSAKSPHLGRPPISACHSWEKPGVRFLAWLLRSLCASGPPQSGERSIPGLSPERQEFAAHTCLYICPQCHTPSRKTVSFRFPLKDYASKLTDLRSPLWRSLGNFKSRRSISLFGLSANPRPISPTRAASPNAPFHYRLLEFPSEPRP